MNTRMLTMLSAAAAVAGVATAPMAMADPAPATGSLNSVEKSIVVLDMTSVAEIQYLDSSNHLVTTDPITAESMCTGEWVSAKADVLTAGHCVDQDENREGIIDQFLKPADGSQPPTTRDRIVNVMGPDGPGSQLVLTVDVTQSLGIQGAVLSGVDPAPAQVIAVIPPAQGDLALLHVGVSLPPTPALNVAAESPSDGDKVTAVGYPGNLVEALHTKWVQVSKFSGTISAHQPKSPLGDWPALEMNAIQAHGMSGGPVLNDKNEIVGTVSHGQSDEDSAQTYQYATDTPQVRAFLQGHGITLQAPAPAAPATATPFVTAPAPQPKPSTLGTVFRAFSQFFSTLASAF